MRGLLLYSLLLLTLAGCADEPPASALPTGAPPTPATGPDTARSLPPPPGPAAEPRAFDGPTTVFDTVESPPPRTLSPPRPVPADPPVPPSPPDRPEPPSDAAAVWGRCDVRPAEPFCFSYVGTGWTPDEAETHCAAAPGGAFGPAACPDAQRIGTCTFERPGADGQTLVYTYYAPYPVDLARLACPGAFEDPD